MRAPRPLLAKRYVVHLSLDVGDAASRFVGTDVTTGQTVILAFAGAEQAERLRLGIGALQRHLAGLVDVIDSPDLAAFPESGVVLHEGPVLVAELIRGRVLADLVAREPLNLDRAVAFTIRMLEGLDALHRRKVPHGALSSYAVIGEPKGRPIAPVISRLIAPALKAYASPERLAGTGPTIVDDLWAVGLLLFEMLTGKQPFRSGPQFEEADCLRLRTMPHGRELEAILRRALSMDPARRPATADELILLLDAWERRATVPAAAARAPIRLPAVAKTGQPAAWDPLLERFDGFGLRLDATFDSAESMRNSILSDVAPVVARSARPPTEGRRRMPSFGPEMAAFRAKSKPRAARWIGSILIVLGVAGGAPFYLAHQRDRELAVSPAPSATEVMLVVANSAVPGRPRLPMAAERSQCIRSYFRPETLEATAELGFVCTEDDFLAVTRRLNEDAMVPTNVAAVTVGSASLSGAVAGMPANVATSPPMVIRSGATGRGWQLGWYELVATAIIRQNCCREAAPIKLPESTGWCQQLQGVVRRIAADSVKVGDLSPGIRAFDEAITCLLAQGRHVVYPYKAVPTSLQKSNLQQFLKHAAEVDARRAARR